MAEEKEEKVRIYRSWMEDNTDLRDSSIRLYCSVMKRYFREHEKLSVDNANEFIGKNSRRKRNFYYRSAFVHYLIMEKRGNDLTLLRKVKANRAKKRPGIYLDKETLFKIVDSIKDERLRFIARLQLYTGCRSYEIIELKWGDLRQDGMLHIRDEKTNKTRTKGLPLAIRMRWHRMKPHDVDDDAYVFFEPKKSYKAAYRRYLYHLKNAAKIFGYANFGTHDFRRNYAEHAKNYFIGQNDPRALEKVQEAMGHSTLDQTKKYWDKTKIDEKELAENIYG